MTRQDGLLDLDELLFADEEENVPINDIVIEQDPWIVLIVDDENRFTK